jgi:hypothetical protein
MKIKGKNMDPRAPETLTAPARVISLTPSTIYILWCWGLKRWPVQWLIFVGARAFMLQGERSEQ